MHFMLLQNGARSFGGFEQHEYRRIDLFHQTRSDNRGYTHEIAAIQALNKQKYRDVIRHLYLALFYYWREGAWVGIRDTYRELASLGGATRDFAAALLNAVRAGDLKLVETYSKDLHDTGTLQILTEVVDTLATIQPAASGDMVAAKALGILADVLPPALRAQVFHYLLLLLQCPEENGMHKKMRLHAAEALRHIQVQLSAEETAMVIEVALAQLQRQQDWTVTREVLKLLRQCFVQRSCSIKPALYDQVIATMLDRSWHEVLQPHSEEVVIESARTAPPHARRRVAAHVYEQKDAIDRLNKLAILGEPVAEEDLAEALEKIFQYANPEPEVIAENGVKSTRIFVSGINPRVLNNFNDLIPPPVYGRVLDGLLKTLLNQNNNMTTRSRAIWALSDLPTPILITRADEVADYLLWGADGTLPTSSVVQWELESQSNPFSMIRMNTGNTEQVQQSSLRGLGRLYPYVAPMVQAKIQVALIATGRHTSEVVRQGVALALKSIEGEAILPARLLLMLVVLLHDAHPTPCAWACVAAAHLIMQNLAEPFGEDMIERLLHLAETASDVAVEVRVGTAIGLRMLVQSAWPTEDTRQRIRDALETLSNDVSFRVRHEARI
jgi:hypothetical protein